MLGRRVVDKHPCPFFGAVYPFLSRHSQSSLPLYWLCAMQRLPCNAVMYGDVFLPQQFRFHYLQHWFWGYATVTIVLTFIIICVCLSEYVASMLRGKQSSKPLHTMPSHFAQCNVAMSVVQIRSQYSCLVVLFSEDVLFCSSPSSDLAARRGVFSRRHYGSVETVSCTFLYQIPTPSPVLSFHQSYVDVKIVPSQCQTQPMAMSLAVVRLWVEQAVSTMGHTSRCCMVFLMPE